MKVRMDDNDPCRYWVSSESDGGKEYLVDLCQWELGPDEAGVMQYNGACICTKTDEQWVEWGCEDFTFRCESRLNKPMNKGKVFRCKHCRAAREHAFNLLLPHLAKHRPNTPDEHQV